MALAAGDDFGDDGRGQGGTLAHERGGGLGVEFAQVERQVGRQGGQGLFSGRQRRIEGPVRE